MHRFPILNYHGLASSNSFPGRASRFWVSRDAFAGHLEQIRSNQLRALSLTALWGSEEGSPTHGFPKNGAPCLTFDDGRASDYEIAYPLLAEAGFTADFFINPATIGQSGYLDWSRVREMHRCGMAFQSHGQDHVDHSGLSGDELKWQLYTSKCEIEDRLGCEVRFFAAPYGEWNHRMAEVAGQVGYRAMCTTAGQLATANAKILDRIGIDSQTSAKQIDAILTHNAAHFRLAAVRFRIKRLPKLLVLKFMPNTVQSWRDRRHA